MKVLRNIKILIFMLLPLSMMGQSKSKLLSIEANLYEISFLNITKHTLRVIIKELPTSKTEAFILSPGEKKVFKGRYSKERLKDLEMFCTYDFKTFRQDLKRFQTKITSRNPSKRSEIKESDWYQFVDDFIYARNVSAYTKEFDFSQLTIEGKSAGKLASDIDQKMQNDKMLFSRLAENNFASSSPNTARSAIAAVLELALHASEYKYVDQVKYLKSTMVMLSDKRFIQKNRNLIYHAADGLDLRTTTPDYIITFTPILFTQKLNNNWLPPNEVALDTDKILSDGLFNNTLSVQVGRSLFPEIRVNNLTYARVYGTMFLEKVSYDLNTFGVYYAGAEYLNVSQNSHAEMYDISNVEDIRLEMTHFGMSGMGKLMVTKWAYLDVEGGVFTRQARLRFRQGNEHFADNAEVNSIKSEITNPVLKRSFSPYIKTKASIGYSTNKGTGVYFSMGFMTAQSFLNQNDNYQLFSKTSDGNILTSVSSPLWRKSVTFGMDVIF